MTTAARVRRLARDTVKMVRPSIVKKWKATIEREAAGMPDEVRRALPSDFAHRGARQYARVWADGYMAAANGIAAMLETIIGEEAKDAEKREEQEENSQEVKQKEDKGQEGGGVSSEAQGAASEVRGPLAAAADYFASTADEMLRSLTVSERQMLLLMLTEQMKRLGLL